MAGLCRSVHMEHRLISRLASISVSYQTQQPYFIIRRKPECEKERLTDIYRRDRNILTSTPGVTCCGCRLYHSKHEVDVSADKPHHSADGLVAGSGVPQYVADGLVSRLSEEVSLTGHVHYVSVLHTVIEIQNKVKKGCHVTLSSESGKTLLDLTGDMIIARIPQRRHLTRLVWDSLNSVTGFKFDVTHFTSYVLMCSRNQIPINHHYLRKRMAELSLQPDEDFLQAQLCNTCLFGEQDKAWEILDEMQSDRFSSNTRSLSERESLPDGILDAMIKRKINPNMETYKVILAHHAAKGDQQAIEKTLFHMEDEYGDLPHIKVYVLLPLLENGYREYAHEVLNSLIAPAEPSVEVNRSFVEYGNLLLIHGYMEEAFRVFCLVPKRGRSFIQAFHASEESVNSSSIVHAVEMALLLLDQSRINMVSLFIDSAAASFGFLVCLMKELKEKGYIKHSGQLKTVVRGKINPRLQESLLVLSDMDLTRLQLLAAKELPTDTNPTKSPFKCVHCIKEQTIQQNEAEAERLFQEFMSAEIVHPRLAESRSTAASLLQAMYLNLGNYTKSTYYLKQSISLNPDHRGHLAKVVYNGQVCLDNGAKNGILDSLDHYLSHSQVDSIKAPLQLRNVLVRLLEPTELFPYLRKIPDSWLGGHKYTSIMEEYMFTFRHDFHTLADAYILFLRHIPHATPQLYIKPVVMSHLLSEGQHHLVNKVFCHSCDILGQPTSAVCLMVSHLLNGDVERFKQTHQKYPEELNLVLKIHHDLIGKFLWNLIGKPAMLNELLIKALMCTHVDAKEIFIQNLALMVDTMRMRRYSSDITVLLRYCVENPHTALAVMMKDIVGESPYLRKCSSDITVLLRC